MERALQSVQHPGRADRHLGCDACTCLGGPQRLGQRTAVGVGLGGRLRQRVRGGTTHLLERVQPRLVTAGAEVVGHVLEHAVARVADRLGDGDHLVGGRVGAGHQSVLRRVQERARTREPERPGRQRRSGDGRHLGDLVAGHVVLVGPPSEHVGPDRGVRQLGADVDRARRGLERVEVLRERLPLPLDALVEGGAGDVLDTLHQLDQEAFVARSHRREPDPTVAHHHGGHTVMAGRGEFGVPRDLPVVVGVDVDPTGRDQGTVGLDLTSPGLGDGADLGDHPAVDRHVGRARRGAGSVDERAPSDHEIVHGVSPSGPIRRRNPPIQCVSRPAPRSTRPSLRAAGRSRRR